MKKNMSLIHARYRVYRMCIQGTDFKNASMHGLLWLHTVASYTFDLNPGHEKQVSEVISFHFAFKHISTPEAYMFAKCTLT